MIFKTYKPMTASESSAIGVATVKFNATCRACGKNEPDKNDYIGYCFSKLNALDYLRFSRSKVQETELYPAWASEREQEWENILKVMRSSNPAPICAVYIAILPSGIKCGETKNLRQRYSALQRNDDILHMYYLPVEDKDQSLAGEDAMHYFFDHVDGLRREKNKKDYYSCDEEYAHEFIKTHEREIYNAIMAEIQGE